MPSLRWVTLVNAISSAPANDICPVVHLRALDMLSLNGSFHESVTLLDHLIMPLRCGLRFCGYDARIGFDQRRLWAIIEKKMDSWARNAPNRCLEASSIKIYSNIRVNIENLSVPGMSWDRKAVERARGRCSSGSGVDPVISISLQIARNQKPVDLFFSLFALFEWTFFDTTYLGLCIEHREDGILPLVDRFRGFVNLEKLTLYDTRTEFPFPFLQQASSVLLPALKSIKFIDTNFHAGSESLLPVANFYQWRREQGFPVQKLEIVQHLCSRSIDREYILAHIQDTVVEIKEYML